MNEQQQTFVSAPKGEGRHAAKRQGLVAEFVACAKKTPALAGLLVISLLLPTIFMGALLFTSLDPQGNMQNVPAVVVNSDRGATIDGEKRNMGQELCDRLINGNAHVREGKICGFSWKFSTSLADAQEGLSRGAYSIMLVIPENFSQSIASSPGKDAQQAQLEAVFNPTVPYGTQQFGYSFLEEVTAGLGKDVQKEKLDDVFVRMTTASNDFLTLTNAGLDLSDGLVSAADGASQVNVGLGELQDGSWQLTDGMNQAASGSVQLIGGIQQLASGLDELKNGIDEASSSPDAVALANALADVGDALRRYGEEAAKENPDPDVQKEALESAERAARAAAAANQTIGEPLVAYIAGGEFSYGTGSSRVTTTEKGLIPAIAEFDQAKRDLEEFEQRELAPLVEALERVAAGMQDADPDFEKSYQDILEYQEKSRAANECESRYRADLENYISVWQRYSTGQATEEELQAARGQMEQSQQDYAAAEAELNEVRTEVMYDMYHVNEGGKAVGLLPAMAVIAEEAPELYELIGSVEKIRTLVTTMMNLIQAQATAGANVAGAAGKCEGYLVGVAVASSYMQGSTAQISQAIASIRSAVAGNTGDTLLLGAQSLSSGISQAAEGSQAVTDGIGQVADGTEALADGLETAADTSEELFDSMGEAQEEVKDATQNSETQSQVLAKPVALEASGLINTLGASLSPYYLFAGLWAGCTIAALVLSRLLKRRRPLAMTPGEIASAVAANTAPLMAATVIQALLAMVIIHAAFGLQIDHIVAFYATGAFAAVAFSIVIGTLVTLLGVGGIVASFVLLALQLALAAGYFPAQATILPLLQLGNLALPLPQAVTGLRVAMHGVNVAYLLLPVAVLAAYAIVFSAVQGAVSALSSQPAIKHGRDATQAGQGEAETNDTHA